jgi:hypothetical protein
MISSLLPVRSAVIRVAAVCFALMPAHASADWLFAPGLGSTFGRDTHGREHLMIATAVGWTGYDPPYGWEIELAYAPDFFEGDDEAFDFPGSSDVGSLMFNGIIGELAAVDGERGWRPYLTAGAGLIQVRVVMPDDDPANLFRTRVREFGLNAGGGVIAFLNEQVGMRADLRYVTSLEDGEASWTRGPSTFDVAPGRFDFFRGTVGITFRLPD